MKVPYETDSSTSSYLPNAAYGPNVMEVASYIIGTKLHHLIKLLIPFIYLTSTSAISLVFNVLSYSL